MQIIFSHPTGNANVRAALNGFLNAGLLKEFHTTIASFPGTPLERLSRLPLFAELNRRSFNGALKKITKSSPWTESGRLLALKSGITSLTRHETGFCSVDAVYRRLDKKVGRLVNGCAPATFTGVYAYEDEALQTFKAAKRKGLTCFYDLPIGYWRVARQLMAQEKERWPDWAKTLTGLRDSAQKLERKDQELGLADVIFVASTFTANTLKAYPGQLGPVNVVPYGFPPPVKDRDYRSTKDGPLKLLFVGGLSQRKGIANLFAAVDQFDSHVELTIVGSKTTSECPVLDRELAKHTWIPTLSNAEILQLMRCHDVLVFPSLFEGFGLVITEAMSQGTPVITTDRTAGPDLISNGENGWIVDAGSIEGLVCAIEHLLLHPEAIPKAGKAAVATAQMRPWEVYGAELAAAVQRIPLC